MATKRATRPLKKPAPPLPRPIPAAELWLAPSLRFLQERQLAGALGDCAFPEFFREARRTVPALSIGQFHDGLRLLQERGQVYLHPWTGPLYDLPEPGLAFLVGHEVAYYVSLRRDG